MEVRVVSRERIRASKSTPQSHRCHKLSLLDQIAPHGYTPVLLFYSADFGKRYEELLRASLADTLNQVFQLAGRVGTGGHTIWCNDQGVDFICTRVGVEIWDVVKQPNIDMMRRLLPMKPETLLDENQVILGVQINTFACGGTCIGLCISHTVADGWSLAVFLNTWAGITRRDKMAMKGYVLDGASIFPPHRETVSMLPLGVEEIASTRIVFDEHKIMALKEKLSTKASRNEAVSAFLWAIVIKTFQEMKTDLKTHVMTSAINMRKRMKPSLSQESIGNVFHVSKASVEVSEVFTQGAVDYKLVVERVQDSIHMVQDGYAEMMDELEEYFERLWDDEKREEVGILKVSSWCRFPFYEVDFGWGKPIWVANAIKAMNVAIFMDTADEMGIEVWLGLSKEHMLKVEKNQDLLAHVSFIQSV